MTLASSITTITESVSRVSSLVSNSIFDCHWAGDCAKAMVSSAQGHPGWVDNHPSSLVYLAASQACLHPSVFTKEEPITTSLPKQSCAEASCSARSSTAPDNADILTKHRPSITYRPKPQVEETKTTYLTINPNIYLPETISEFLVSTMSQNFPQNADAKFMSMFRSTNRCQLRRVNVQHTKITDSTVCLLLNHKLTHLDIRHCMALTTATWYEINKNAKCLIYLALSNSIVPPSVPDCSLYLPYLRELVLSKVSLSTDSFMHLLGRLTNVKSLDLTNCKDLGDLSYILHLKLVSLCLHNTCQLSDVSIKNVSKLTTIRHLDISRSKSKKVSYSRPDRLMERLLRDLPHLSHLDISGTNLAGDKKTTTWLDKDGNVESACDIESFSRWRRGRPLDVLGLFNCTNNPCEWDNLPADKVLGDATEQQVLDSLEVLMPHEEQAMMALNGLFHEFRQTRVDDIQRALKLTMQAMQLYHSSEQIQITASACLFYIMWWERAAEEDALPNQKLTDGARQQLLVLLVNAMERFPRENTLLRNTCLAIRQMQLPKHVLFQYRRIMTALIAMVRSRGNAVTATTDEETEVAELVLRSSIYLINCLACQVEGQHKLLLGELSLIQTILDLITERVDTSNYDDILENAWSVLWNVTDETPSNCLLFLNRNGLEYFSRTLAHALDPRQDGECDNLLRNMMGFMGNVAETKELRQWVVTAQHIRSFVALLSSRVGGFEVNYNAAGVLSHILSDGCEAWTFEEQVKREDVTIAMEEAIRKWDMSATRNINYRSFEPILRMLRVQHTTACRLWAVWALANLTRVYARKYCELLVSEGGIKALEDQLDGEGVVGEDIRNLARCTISHCRIFQRDGTLHRLYPQM